MSDAMPKRRGFPLLAKLLAWLLLNLLVVVALFVWLSGAGGFGWNILLSEPVRERLLEVSDHVAAALSAENDESKWPAILASSSDEYGMRFTTDRDGPPPDDHGDRHPPPQDQAFGDGPHDDRRQPPPDDGRPPSRDDFRGDGPHGPPPQEGSMPPGRPGDAVDGREDGFDGDRNGGPPGPPPIRDRHALAQLIYVSHAGPFREWRVTMPAMLTGAGRRQAPIMLSASTPELIALLRFLGIVDWLRFLLLATGGSIALWSLFVWDITRTVGQLTRATRRIAEGRFDARVPERRRDELGELADAVNRMAERLEQHLAGQRRFVADVAHEITSPLARLQVGISLLEPHLAEPARDALADVREDLDQMASMLDELLMFSRAGVTSDVTALETVPLLPLIRAVLAREDTGTRVAVSGAAEQASVRAQPLLLQRAFANLVRNAIRYGSVDQHSAIEIIVDVGPGDRMRIRVRDRGPGVPPNSLARLGEPFFRPELSRSRETGGYGLGLAIVRRCIEACDGEVTFHNRNDGGGFEAEICLHAA